MEVSSVSSSNSAALLASLQAPVRNRTAEQDQQAQPTPLSQPQQPQSSQSSQAVQGTNEAQASASANERQAQTQAQSEPSRPTVNLNGQTVGTLVNTTA